VGVVLAVLGMIAFIEQSQKLCLDYARWCQLLSAPRQSFKHMPKFDDAYQAYDKSYREVLVIQIEERKINVALTIPVWLLGILLIVLARPKPDELAWRPPGGLSRITYVTALATLFGLAWMSFVYGYLFDQRGTYRDLLIFSHAERVPVWIGWGFFSLGLAVMARLYYRMWHAIEDGQTRTSATLAVALLLAPILNIYWSYRALAGYPREYNRFLRRHDLKEPELRPWLFAVHLTIFWLSVLVWIIALGYVILKSFEYTDDVALSCALGIMAAALVNYVLFLILVAKICNAVNRIADSNKTGLSQERES